MSRASPRDSLSAGARRTFASAMQLHQRGELRQAETLYRQVLAGAPAHAEALHMLGLVALQSGRYAEARDQISRAVAQAPRLAEAHNHLGLALQELGRPIDAEAAFREAIKRKRDCAPAWLNLANLLATSGRTDEAIAALRRALAIEPDNAAAERVLAQLQTRRGDTDAAESHYRAALRKHPGDASAHTELAALLRGRGRLDDAIAHFKAASELMPRSAAAFMNLALALRDRRRWREAAHAALKADAVAPDDVTAKTVCADCLKALDPLPDDLALAAPLARALAEAWDRPQQLAAAALRLLRADPEGPLALDLARAWSEDAPPARPSSVSLLLELLTAAPVADAAAECLFTAWRRAALDLCTAARTAGAFGVALAGALARQCFLNEYAWAESAEETAALSELLQRIDSALGDGGAIAPAWLAIVGSYRSLESVRGIDRRLTQAWPDPVMQCLTQQVVEPRREAAQQAELPRLTAIRDAVSERVRAQYETNPYPRWTRPVLAVPGASVHGVLRAVLPGLALDGDDPAAPEILVAGCGTGQHAIETALRFRNGRVLAVDLSLGSLAYARRKTEEAGIGTIEYAQADILELGSLTRRFDVIESAGVLHHLDDPEAGWRVLVGLLRPGGVMKIGLYSELARAPIVRARDAIAARGYGAAPADIRRFRQEMDDFLDAETVAILRASADFYSTSGCRDLLFHVQEHRFSLPQIEAMVARLGLEFLGFELPPGIGPRADAAGGADSLLARWHSFEREHPTTFAGMYQLWLRRPRGAASVAAAAPAVPAADRLAEALALHRAGRLADAERLYQAVLRERPDQPDALHLLGLLAHQRGDDATAVSQIRRALQHRPDFAIAHNNLGNILRARGERADAAASYQRALALNPALAAAEIGLAGLSADTKDFDDAARRLEATVARHPSLAQAWYELGCARRRQRRVDDAIAALQRAVTLEPKMFAAHNELGIALHEAGRWEEAVEAYHAALSCAGDRTIAQRNLGHALKRLGRTAEAVDCYRLAAAHRETGTTLDAATLARATYATTSQVKLAHDIEQLAYLAARGWRPAEAAELIERYRRVLTAIKPRGAPGETVRLTDEERQLLGPDYNRQRHVADAPALAGGPFGGWQPDAIERTYLAARPELAVIDDFLSPEALAALWRYCVESTVWFDFSHRDGYLAAFIDDRFDCPLLLQIADELRRVLPRMLGPHSLVHIWAYKYDSTLAGVGIHGDNAAVNVNFWIAPDDANLDPQSGGMVVYPALAPLDWRFEDFNADSARIEAFLAAHGGAPMRVPYRVNRAVLFNSSLFHETDRFRFKPAYDRRRINITMLFGDRRAGVAPQS